MNRGIFVFLGAVAVLGLAGLYFLQQGAALFVSRPDAEHIAFVSERGGQRDIWTMRTDGSDARRITNDAAANISPAWSPDAREIVSASNREDDRYEIYVSSWNGSYTKRLTVSAGTKDLPEWGPDGKEIVCLSSGRVFVIARATGEDLQVMPTLEQGVAESGMIFVRVGWSPKRRTLAGIEDTSGLQTAVVREDFDNPMRETRSLTTLRDGTVETARRMEMDWSGRDYYLAVSFVGLAAKGGSPRHGIFISDISTMSSREVFLTGSSDLGPGALAWSPDGKQIAFEMWRLGDGYPDKCIGIYLLDLNGRALDEIEPGSLKPRVLVKGDAREPTWSPDGKNLAYTLVGADGRRDIWCAGADGKGATNLTNGDGDNSQPRWSPAVKRR